MFLKEALINPWVGLIKVFDTPLYCSALLDKASRSYETALTISSTTFFASPKTIIVLSM
jgi:hypothetical protein